MSFHAISINQFSLIEIKQLYPTWGASRPKRSSIYNIWALFLCACFRHLSFLLLRALNIIVCLIIDIFKKIQKIEVPLVVGSRIWSSMITLWRQIVVPSGYITISRCSWGRVQPVLCDFHMLPSVLLPTLPPRQDKAKISTICRAISWRITVS